ncbi:uncharacterized protein G6M90_00g109030 [Metarhizium brunneum]|uniref:LysM domain-containing protein n=1 Tax=Metarhizium brunneum TaxID=500148 RepID=A0A7D5Z806_9HYPO|nr:hypothetical protein G6M90_00g109030 [Metarhizium brunneum]
MHLKSLFVTAWRRLDRTDVTTQSSTSVRTTTTKSTSTLTISSSPHSSMQPGLVPNRDKLYLVLSGGQCGSIEAEFGVSSAHFYAWNPSINTRRSFILTNVPICGSATGIAVQMHQEGACINTNCRVGPVKAIPQGICPDGQIQISYWEQLGCTGKWFGDEYTSRDTRRKMWTEGWKFKSLYVRCASEKDDCVSKGACTFDPEPANNVC